MALTVKAHHISFPVKDVERARSFYEGVLGLQTIPRPDLGLPGVWYRAGACEVHLIQYPDGMDVGAPPAAINPLGRHDAFAIESYEVALAHLKSKGIDVLETTPQQGQMWVKDPDGHVIELIAAPA